MEHSSCATTQIVRPRTPRIASPRTRTIPPHTPSLRHVNPIALLLSMFVHVLLLSPSEVASFSALHQIHPTSPTSISTCPSKLCASINPLVHIRHHNLPLLTKRHASNLDNHDYSTTSTEEKALGVLVLLTVPLAWGTYAPVVKYIYEMDPPIPGFLFSTAYYLIASASLIFLMNMNGESMEVSNQFDASSDAIDEQVEPAMSLPIQGGLELGSYLFLGNCLQVVGLQTVPADRAAFLVQLTTIMVPIVQATFARDLLAISVKTWVACLLAFGGVVVMEFDGKEMSSLVGGDGSEAMTSSVSTVANTFSGGDLLIIMAAVAYTMHVVRLGKYAQSTTPLRLAAAKASVEAVMSLTLIFCLVSINNGAFGSDVPEFLDKTGREVATYISTFGDSLAAAETSTLLPAIAACLWTGWVTCAYTIYAQSFGQRRVSPTDANLIYTTQPIFSSLFAFALLGETLGAAGIAGGALIAAALWLITASEDISTDDTL